MAPDAMRARADQLKASAREDSRSAYEADREAAQLSYEAGLIEDAELALAELTGARQHAPKLEAKATDALADVRSAEDRVRAEERQLRRVRSEQGKADPRDGDTLERLAVRATAREGAVRACHEAARTARAVLEQAEAAVRDWQAHVDQLEADHAEAARRAAHPGTAPGAPGLAPGVSGLGDMDDQTKGLLVAAVLLMAADKGGPSLGPDVSGRKRDPRLTVAQQDPTQMRFLRHGRGTIAIPPARRG